MSFIKDSFTGSDGSLLSAHTADTGATWVKNSAYTGDVLIDAANRIRAGSGSGALYSSAVAPGYDMNVSADFIILSNVTSDISLCARMSTSSDTMYCLRMTSSTPQQGFDVYKVVAGSGTVLVSQLYAFSQNVVYNLALKVIGSTLTVLINGNIVWSGSDGSITTGNRVGIRALSSGSDSDTTGVHIDNFKGYFDSYWVNGTGKFSQPIYVNDTFVGTAGTNLSAHTSNYGATWAKNGATTGNFLLDGNGLIYNAATGESIYNISSSGATPDYTVSLDVTCLSASSSTEIGVIGRGSNTAMNMYMLQFSNNNVNLFVCNNGAYTQLGSSYAFTPTVGVPFTIQLTMAGTNIQGVLNGTVVINAFDATYSAPGYAGVRAYEGSGATTGTHGTNFRVENINWSGHSGGVANPNYYPDLDSVVTMDTNSGGTSPLMIVDTSDTINSLIAGSSPYDYQGFTGTIGGYSDGKGDITGGITYPQPYSFNIQWTTGTLTISTRLQLGGECGVSGVPNTAGVIFNGNATWQQFCNGYVPKVILNAAGQTLTIDDGYNAGAGSWYGTNASANTIDVQAGTFLFPLWNNPPGGHSENIDSVVNCNTFTTANSTSTRTVNFNGSGQYNGAYLNATTLLDFSVATGLTLSNLIGSQIFINGQAQAKLANYSFYYIEVVRGRTIFSGNFTLSNELQVDTGAIANITGSTTIALLNLEAGTGLVLQSGQTQNITAFAPNMNGAYLNNISVSASTKGSQANVNLNGQNYVVSWWSVADIHVTSGQITVYRGINGGDDINVIFIKNVQRYYNYAVYKYTGAYVGQFNDVTTDPAISQEINNPGGELVIQRQVDPSNFGEYGIVDYMNRVIITAYTEDNINGIVIYNGFISSWLPNWEQGNDYVQITLLPYGAELSQYPLVSDPIADVTNGHDSATYPSHTQSDSGLYMAQKWISGSNATTLSGLTLIWSEVGTGFGDQTQVWEVCPDNGGAPDRTRVMATGTSNGAPYQISFTPALDITPNTPYYVVLHNPAGGTMNSYACVPGSGGNNVLLFSSTGTGILGWTQDSHTYAMADFVTKTATGNTSVSYTGSVYSALEDIMSNYNTLGGKVQIGLIASALQGVTFTYEFQTNTVLDGIQKCIDAAPAGYYWYIDLSTNLLYVLQVATTPTHYFTYGRDILKVQLQKTMETVVNNLLVTGGDDGSGFNLYRNYLNIASKNRYGRRFQSYNDSQLTDSTIADQIGEKSIYQQKDPVARAPITVIGQPDIGYNLEIINPGDTFTILGINGFVMQQISRVDYKAYSVDVTASTIPPQINVQATDTASAVSQQQTDNNPAYPTQVVVT